MNGEQINASFNAASSMCAVVHHFTGLFDDSTENLALGCYIILSELDILVGIKDATDFEKTILEIAKDRNSIAGMDYNENEFLNADDEDFEPSDDGLAWVTFGDVWNALVETAEHFNNLVK